MVHVDEQLYHTLINMVSVRVIFRSVVRGFDVSNVIFEARVNNDALRLFWLAYRRVTEECWKWLLGERGMSRSDDAVFIAGHAHMLCLERVVKCQSRNPESTSCGGGE